MSAPDAPLRRDRPAEDPGIPGDAGPVDLDRLIGELETEGARRRAEPDYPHDADARLHFELEHRAPRPPEPEAVRALLAHLETTVSALVAAGPGAAPRGRLHRARRDREPVGQLAAVALAVSAAVRALAERLDALERRFDAHEPAHPDASTSPAAADSDALGEWRHRLLETIDPGDGRVLYADARAEEVVAELRAAGADAYGVSATGPRDRPGPDVRTAGLLDHLRSVDGGALAVVVLAGAPEAMTPASVRPLVAELGRTASSVVVVSEAPWWWRRRLGAVAADLAPGHPLDPETWLDALDAVGLTASAQYGPSGRSYRVVARLGARRDGGGRAGA
jgi:hypothetical protein